MKLKLWKIVLVCSPMTREGLIALQCGTFEEWLVPGMLCCCLDVSRLCLQPYSLNRVSLVQWSDGNNLYSSCKELSIVAEKESRMWNDWDWLLFCPCMAFVGKVVCVTKRSKGMSWFGFLCGESKVALNVDCYIRCQCGCRGYRYISVAWWSDTGVCAKGLQREI